MLSQERKEEIAHWAAEVNRVSENYQLIHATFAIEKIFRDHIEEEYNQRVLEFRQKLGDPALNANERKELMQQFENLRSAASKKYTIRVNYIRQIKEGSARITQTKNNTFLIALPKAMENTRQADGKIDLDRLLDLRQLMAHELGHIVLHSGVLDTCKTEVNTGSEDEAVLFAENLITLRRKRNSELYDKQNYRRI